VQDPRSRLFMISEQHMTKYSMIFLKKMRTPRNMPPWALFLSVHEFSVESTQKVKYKNVKGKQVCFTQTASTHYPDGIFGPTQNEYLCPIV
ncbi:hypothetical protein HPG69_001037, partial [Diceros bicornis minor]